MKLWLFLIPAYGSCRFTCASSNVWSSTVTSRSIEMCERQQLAQSARSCLRTARRKAASRITNFRCHEAAVRQLSLTTHSRYSFYQQRTFNFIFCSPEEINLGMGKMCCYCHDCLAASYIIELLCATSVTFSSHQVRIQPQRLILVESDRFLGSFNKGRGTGCCNEPEFI